MKVLNNDSHPDFIRSAERDIIQNIFETRWDEEDSTVITYEECARAIGKSEEEATRIMRTVKQYLQVRFRDPKYFIAIPTVGYQAAIDASSHKSVVTTGANKARNQAKRNLVCVNALLTNEEKAKKLSDEERKMLTAHACIEAARIELSKTKNMKRLANQMPSNHKWVIDDVRKQLEHFRETLE